MFFYSGGDDGYSGRWCLIFLMQPGFQQLGLSGRQVLLKFLKMFIRHILRGNNLVYIYH